MRADYYLLVKLRDQEKSLWTQQEPEGSTRPWHLAVLEEVVGNHPEKDTEVEVNGIHEPHYCPTCLVYQPCPAVTGITKLMEGYLGECVFEQEITSSPPPLKVQNFWND